MTVIVDTNVAIVANDRESEQASPACRLACLKQIELIIENENIALDVQRLILNEYRRNLREAGQPGVGDRFLRWILLNLNTERVEWVSITPVGDDNFQEFPDDERLKNFDRSDRKFVAVALIHSDHPPILNAVDTDWLSFKEILLEFGVKVEFLCPDDIQRLAAEQR